MVVEGIFAEVKPNQNYITVRLHSTPIFHKKGKTLLSVQSAAWEDGQPTKEEKMVLLPEAVDAVANGAFSGADFLRHVFWGKDPVNLGSNVFTDCVRLETAVLAEGTDKIPLGTFAECKKLKTVQLPRSVRRIHVDAFKNCRVLQEIDLPPELEKIEASAFWGCHALKEILLPDTVTELGEDAFANCTGLRHLRLPSSLKKIGGCAFQNCIGLETVEIPEGVRSLPMGVFAGCRNLKRVRLPETIEHISPYAFYRCEALETVEYAGGTEETPFLEGPPVRFPMELLYQFAGEVSGCMLSAMGYPWFDIDCKYRFFLTDRPGVVEVRSRRFDAEYPPNAQYDSFFVDDRLDFI